MRKAINKDFFREIKYTLNRYLSLTLIVALGVAFFAGIRATCPDMKLTLDKYLDETNYMDIRVLSTLGLTDEDIEAIAEIEGVAAVDAAYSYDAFVMHGDEKRILRFLSLPEGVSEPELVDGRWIEADYECLIDRYLITKYGYAIGDTIVVTSPSEDEDVLETLSTDTYTIVGVVTSPNYFTNTRDTTSVGTGQTDAFVYLSKNVFLTEAYSAAYILVEGAADETVFSDAYDEVVEAVTERLEAISAEREAARYDGIMSDANEELDEARQELADAKIELEEELADAWAQITDGQQEIEDGYETLADSREEYEVQIADAKAALIDGEQELTDAEATIALSEIELTEGEEQLAIAKENVEWSRLLLEENQSAYESGLAEALQGQEQIDAAYAQLEAAAEALTEQTDSLMAQKESLETQKSGLEDNLSSVEMALTQINAGLEVLYTQKTEIESTLEVLQASGGDESQIAELEILLTEVESQIASLEIQASTLETQKGTIENGIVAIEDGLIQIEAGLTQIDDALTQLEEQEQLLAAQQVVLAAVFAQLEEAKLQLEEGQAQLAKADAQIADSEDEIADGRLALESAKEQLAAGYAEIEEGWQELLVQMADAEEQFAQAEKELAEGEEELEDAIASYYSAKAEAEEEIADAEQKIADAQAELEDISYPEWYVLDRNSTQGYVEYGQNADRIGAIGRVFPMIFFLVAALMSLTTMTRMVESQRTQIGTLKALGYSNRAIAKKYVLYALSASVIGSAIGLIIGQKTLPWIIINAYSIIYPNFKVILLPLNAFYSITASLAAIVCVTGAALLSCYKELMASPANLMRPEAPKVGKKIWLEHIGFIWHRLNFTAKVAMRNLFRYKKRFFMTIFGISGCTALVLFSFGLTDSISSVVTRQYEVLFKYDITLTMDDGATEDELDELTTYLSETEEMQVDDYIFVRYMGMELTGNKAAYTAYLTVPEDADAYENFVTFQDRETEESYSLDDETVLITEKLSELLDLQQGDTMTIEDKDQKVEVTVGAIIENYLVSYVYMSPKLYETVFGEAPEWNIVQAIIGDMTEDNTDEIAEKLLSFDAISGVTPTNNTRESFASVLDSLGIVTMVLLVSAGLLAFIVLYNLNNINITERRRELATIRVLGFYDLELGMYIYRENIMLTFIGSLVGLVFGKYLHAYIITTVETDIIMFVRHAEPISYLYAVLITFAFSLFVNWLMFYRLRKIDMVESLKSVE